MHGVRVVVAGVCAAGGMFVAASPANALPAGVGVDGCVAVSPGNYAEGQCRSVTLPGYYRLSIDGRGGFASAQVDCTQGGSLSVSGTASEFAFGYLNGGVCTVSAYSEYATAAELDPS